MGFVVRVRSAGQKYGPTCHQRDRADVTEFVTLVRLSSLGQHVGVLALPGYKRRKSALAAGTIDYSDFLKRDTIFFFFLSCHPTCFGLKHRGESSGWSAILRSEMDCKKLAAT